VQNTLFARIRTWSRENKETRKLQEAGW